VGEPRRGHVTQREDLRPGTGHMLTPAEGSGDPSESTGKPQTPLTRDRQSRFQKRKVTTQENTYR
jgi:hypothetical protein